MISVVIPTLNEQGTLAATISALGRNDGAYELLVVDADSKDGTRNLAESLGAKVIVTPIRQRAAQLNLGAKQARGDILLFLHADTVVPSGALARIQAALRDVRVGGGAFARRFNSESIFLKTTCALAELRNHAIGWHLGDQGIFVRGSCFQHLSGFREMDRFEDLDFSRRLRGVSRVVTLRPPVVSSARRFAADGPVRRTLKDFLLTLDYLRGSNSAALPRPAAT